MVRARFINETNTVNVNPVTETTSVNVRSIGTATSHDQLIHRDLPDQHPISAITDLTETLSGIGGNIGDLENLTTENKDSLVSAINEVDSHADTNASNLSNHIADKNNPHEVTKAQVGLGNCDNTSDLNKPISTATQIAITAEENRAKGVEGSLSNLTTTDKSNLVSAINEVDSDKQDNVSAGTGIDITANVISVTDPTLINNGTGTNALAVGKSSQATGEGGVSVGQGARANSTYATAVGQETRATNTNTVALGRGAKATEQRAIAIGSGAEANAPDAIAIKGINNTANTFQVYNYQMLDMSNGLIPNERINIDSTPTENSTNTVSSGGVYTMVNNIITGTTSIDYDNTTSGLSATTIKGAIDEIDDDLDNVEALIPSEASSSNQLADKSYVDTADGGLQSQITTNAGDIDTIEGKIPSAASSSNQLADKNFVNSSISTNTANFIGTFNSVADLEAYFGTLTNNDYAFVIVTDSLGNTAYDRYKYTTATTPASWQFEYELNNSSFTSDQWAAINSGATTTNIGQIATNTNAISGLSTSKQDKIDSSHKLDSDLVDDTNQTNKFVTSTDITNWNAKQDAISDLSTIREGAALGATSVQSIIQGETNGTLNVDGTDVAVKGLGSAAYTPSTDYATAAQGALADTAVQPSDLATVATTGDYDDLTNKPTIGNAVLTIQKNEVDIDSFTANATSNKTINITVPTQASDINAVSANTAITGSTKCKITYDSKGLVTGGSDLSADDIPNLSLTKITDVTVSATELNYTDGVTSNIQTQINDKQDKIDSSHKLDSDLVDDTNQTNKFVTASEKSQITTNKNAIGTLSSLSTTVKTDLVSAINEVDGVAGTAIQPSDLATVATSGSYNDLTNKPTIPTVNNATLTIQKNGATVQTFTANQSTNATANITVPTQASDINAADTSLSNLSSDGQMIIDSQNGTISNCITEIPQNIKLELSSGTLTLKAGSKVYVPNGSGVFDTVTITSDLTGTYTVASSQRMFFYNVTGRYFQSCSVVNVYSGTTDPTGSGTLYWYDTTNNLVKRSNDGGSTWSSDVYSLPFCLCSIADNNISNIDQIFNGAGFIGHHAFVLPNVKALIPDGFNEDGSLKSILWDKQQLFIKELETNVSNYTLCLQETYPYINYSNNSYWRYSKEQNKYIHNQNSILFTGLADYSVDSNNVVTDFTIHQPVHLATTEMLDEIEEQVVKLTGTQTITGGKTFTVVPVNLRSGYGGYYVRRSDLEYNVTPNSNTVYGGIEFQDKNNVITSAFQSNHYASGAHVSSISVRGEDNTTSYLRLYRESNGTAYATCPAPSEDNTTSTQIDTVGARNTKLSTLFTSITGYDVTATQVLKNINGTLTWVTES